MTILRALSVFAFMTCLKFSPVVVPPGDEHVLLFENPTGIKKCDLLKHGHTNGPHIILLGYDCLATPMIERIIMRSLGFYLEHNRINRDEYIDVQPENVDPSAMELFTKESNLPAELKQLPYDVDSVMHFGPREYTKNGHRTIIFKDPDTKQSRSGLSSTDVRKIEIVYGPECRKRDRQEKTDLCRTYPTKRSKRSIVVENKSLRVNPDITPPPEIANGNQNISDEVSATLNNLGIAAEVQAVVDDVYKLTSKALKTARGKYCNETHTVLREGDENEEDHPDILGIIKVVAKYTQSMVDNAIANMSMFCDEASTVNKYQNFLRFKCAGYVDMRGICHGTYRSTKSGRVVYSTQHRPVILQSTWHIGGVSKSPKDKLWRRSDNASEVTREKREVEDSDKATEALKNVTEVQDKVEDIQPARPDGDSAKADEVEVLMAREDTPDTILSANEEIARRARDSGYSDSEDSHSNEGKKSNSDERATDRWQSKNEKRTTKDRWHNSEERPTGKEDEEKESRIVSERPKSQNRFRIKPSKAGLPTTVELSKKNEEFYAQRRWPGGVSSEFEGGIFMCLVDIADVRSRLDEVNQLLKKRTCVRLEEIWARDANKYDDYLVLDHSPDFVTGRVGKKQHFGASELLKGGQHRQHAAMMVMAMLGFYFELSRHDRDKYVRVNLRHIRPDKLHHFEKIRSDATLPLEYDFKSATHPAWQYWRKVGRTGISTVATYKDQDPDGSIMKSLGQHEDLLSEGDYIKINSVYGIECMTGSARNDDDRRHNNKN